jgi:hypothetical protein
MTIADLPTSLEAMVLLRRLGRKVQMYVLVE